MILQQINDRIGNLEGKIGISYMDLLSGQSCFAGNCDVFVSSGAVKLLVLIEIFRQMEQGTLARTDKYVLTEADHLKFKEKEITPSYGVLNYLHPGLELTVEDLFRLMVFVSDNAACNILIEKVGMNRINKTMRKLGFAKSTVNRILFDYASVEAGIENYHSVQEYSEIFLRLYKGQLISKSASSEILWLMKQHQRTNVIPYYFDEDLPIAHQTGYDGGIIHDAGIVFTKTPFVLCMGANDVDTRKAESVMRDIAQICSKNSERVNIG